MSKTLLYRMFRLGSIPKDAASHIRQEGIVLQDEGIGGSVTFKKFRAPGKRFNWRRNWFSGSVVLTRKHFLAFGFSKPLIGLALDDEKFKQLKVSIENGATLCVAFEASTFHDDASGGLEVRLSTPLARDFFERIDPHTR